MRSPAKLTSPERGFTMPISDCSSVDLPAPLAPATTTISPSFTEMEMSEMATSPA